MGTSIPGVAQRKLVLKPLNKGTTVCHVKVIVNLNFNLNINIYKYFLYTSVVIGKGGKETEFRVLVMCVHCTTRF